MCRLLAHLNTAVLVKGVDTSITERDLTHTLKRTYSGVTVTRFVKNRRPLTTVRIDFQSKEAQQDCIKKGIRHNGEFFNKIEEYVYRQRIIQCYHCYAFGHVAKWCSQRNPTCNFCGEGHSSQDCRPSNRLKCRNCKEEHEASSKDCTVYKEIVKTLNNQNSISAKEKIL